MAPESEATWSLLAVYLAVGLALAWGLRLLWRRLRELGGWGGSGPTRVGESPCDTCTFKSCETCPFRPLATPEGLSSRPRQGLRPFQPLPPLAAGRPEE